MTSPSAHPDEIVRSGHDPRPAGDKHEDPRLTGEAPVGHEVERHSGDPRPAEDKHEDPRLTGQAPVVGARPISVLLYSDDVDTRGQVRLALGKRISADLPPLEWTEVATQWAVLDQVDNRDFDVLILDGEAAPVGGLGLCKQLKDEKYQCPPILVLTGRPQDAWLATWSRADAAVPHPLDPRALSESVAGLARRRRG